MYICSHEADRILIDQDHAVIMFLKTQTSTAPEEVTKQVSKLFEERDASAIRARLYWLLPEHMEGQMDPASTPDMAEGLVMSACEVFAIINDFDEWHSINEGTHKDIQDFFAKREGQTSTSREEVRMAEQQRQGRAFAFSSSRHQSLVPAPESRSNAQEQRPADDHEAGWEGDDRQDGAAVAGNSEVHGSNSSELVNSGNETEKHTKIVPQNVRHLKFWTPQEVLFPHHLLSRELSPIRSPCPRVADFPDSTSHGTHVKLKLIPYTPYSGAGPA
jgi:hypothetical protein